MAKDETSKVDPNEPPPKGKHDHGSGTNPAMGSTYKGKHVKKEK